MNEVEEIIQKIDAFMDKKDIELKDKYMITKIMNEQYWEDIKDESDSENDDDEDDFSEFEDNDDSEELEEEIKKMEDDEEIDLDKEIEEEKPKNHKKGIKGLLGRKKIKTK